MWDCWLMFCMSYEVLKQVSGFDIARDARVRLVKYYATCSHAKVIQVREESQNFKKGNLSISNYMIKIKLLNDELEA